MRLKTIKISGFKSFADPVIIHVPPFLSGIVGPNGSGKSNVIDAMRWVTGESSAKSLRGDKLDDVIFSGSSDRKPAARASVELLFDNSLGRCHEQWAKYAEISIRRIATRDSNSEYFINGSQVRRRDVKDLFLGTGFGARSYSIIEQGMISRIVEAKPDELSSFIEEASGVSRFRDRRHETTLKLKRTADNLLRLSDMRTEVEKQLRQLKRQAGQARQYRKMKDKARVLKAQLLSVDWQDLNRHIEKFQSDISSYDMAKQENLARMRKAEANVELERQRQIDHHKLLSELQMEQYRVNAEISNLSRQIKEKTAAISQQKQLLETKSTQMLSITERIAELKTQADTAQREHQRVQVQLNQASTELHERQTSLDQAQRQLTSDRALLEQVNQRFSDVNSKKHSTSASIDQVRIKRDDAARRIGELKIQIAQLESSANNDASEPIRVQLNQLLAEQSDLREKVLASESSLSDKRSQSDELGAQLDQLRDQAQEVQVRLNTLKNSASDFDASEEALKWLEQNGGADAIAAADRIAVRSGWERAVDTALGDKLSAVLVKNIEQVASKINDKAFPTRVYFIEDAKVEVEFAHTEALANFVDSDEHVIEGMLSGIYAAKDIDDALSRKESLRVDECVVTANGAIVGRNWFSPAVSQEGVPGVLETSTLIRQCTKQVEFNEVQQHDKRQQIADNRHTIGQIELELTALRADMTKNSEQTESVRKSLSESDADYLRLQQKLEHMRLQLSERIEEEKQAQKELDSLKQILENQILQCNDIEQEKTQITQKASDQSEAVEQIRQAFNLAIQDKHRLDLQAQQHESEQTTFDASRIELENRFAQLQCERDALELELSEDNDPTAELTKQLEQYVVEARKWDSKLGEARSKTDETDNAYRHYDQQRAQYQLKVDQFSAKIQQCEVELGKLTVKVQEKEHSITDLETSPQEQLNALDEDFDYQVIQKKLERLLSRIESGGAVNLIAVEQYEEELERKQYMDSQHDDLTRAVNILQETIAKIDKQSRERYTETFEQINSEFQRVMPLLFGGGSGHLEFDGEYPHNPGIQIFARPKGKRINSIHLLSGGEKALTAVALLLSFFQLNPSPVCLLDEIDAPLDDENVYRLCARLRDLSQTTQLVLITHNKITMESVDALIGVTMPQPNVSRVLSVDLQDAQEFAA